MIYSQRNRRVRGGPALPVLTGYQTVTLDTTTYSGDSIQQAVSPAAAVGDSYLIGNGVLPDGYQIIANQDGTFTVLTGGDTSREAAWFFFRRLSTGNLEGQSGPGDPNPGVIWLNEVAAVWLGGVILQRTQGLVVGQPITPIALVGNGTTNFVSSPEGDALTITVASGALPPGLTIDSVSGIIGTPTATGTYNFTLSAVDSTGEPSISPASFLTIIPGVILPPPSPYGQLPAGGWKSRTSGSAHARFRNEARVFTKDEQAALIRQAADDRRSAAAAKAAEARAVAAKRSAERAALLAKVAVTRKVSPLSKFGKVDAGRYAKPDKFSSVMKFKK